MRKKFVLTLPLLVGVAQASSSISPKIVNGNIAKSADYPSIATLFVDSLEYDGRYSSGNYCGASILDANHVLTAAHCVYTQVTSRC
jgi:secreted trypsin-like serine protease